MNHFVYKLLTLPEWEEFENSAAYGGSALDQEDGFIHLSTGGQVKDTARLHFSRFKRLKLLQFEADRLGEDLIYEASRGGDLFPHLYAPLRQNDMMQVWDLPQNADGRFEFPDLKDLTG